jgi:hypothetical protein
MISARSDRCMFGSPVAELCRAARSRSSMKGDVTLLAARSPILAKARDLACSNAFITPAGSQECCSANVRRMPTMCMIGKMRVRRYQGRVSLRRISKQPFHLRRTVDETGRRARSNHGIDLPARQQAGNRRSLRGVLDMDVRWQLQSNLLDPAWLLIAAAHQVTSDGLSL